MKPIAEPIAAAATDRPDSARPTKPRILIVDDHPITRQGLKALLGQQIAAEICGEADNALQALQLVSELQPEIVVLDVSLKSANGIELVKEIRERAPETRVLVVSMHDEGIYAERALQAGAMGYVMKQEAGEKVALAIRDLLRGELYLSAKMREKMLHGFVNKKSDRAVFSMDTLSEREKEVFRFIGDGYSTREIANRLSLSSKTIDSYREHLKLKLGLATGAELVRHAIEWARHAAKV